MMSLPVIFPNRRGERLFGILEEPAEPVRHDTAVLLLSPGVKMRVGPQRLYTRMSRQFVDLGFPVLRFDYYGLGDSEGEVKEALLKDVYNHIEVGRFVGDTIDAMNWLQAEHGKQRFILAGLCGGAVTGLLVGAQDPRVAGLLGLGITPVLASRAANPALYMTSGELSLMRRTYFSKLLNPFAWWRLLSMKSDYTLLWRSLMQPFRPARTTPATTEPSAANADNTNPLFAPALFAIADSGRPLLLVFGGADRLQWEFEEKFAARYRERLAGLSGLCQVHVIANANHTLSFQEWQQEMLEVTRGWLASRFDPSVAPAPSGRADAGA